jgi:hypothetical protein
VSKIRGKPPPVPGKSGPRPNGDLADIIDLMLATGTRIGEVLAIRACDIDDRQLTISGTLVEVRSLGLFRQSWTKSDAGYRTVVLPQFALDVIARRIERAASNIEGALFSSRTGNWKSPNNVRRQWRQARGDTALEWVTPHIFRKTVGTVVDRETDTKTAAAPSYSRQNWREDRCHRRGNLAIAGLIQGRQVRNLVSDEGVAVGIEERECGTALPNDRPEEIRVSLPFLMALLGTFGREREQPAVLAAEALVADVPRGLVVLDDCCQMRDGAVCQNLRDRRRSVGWGAESRAGLDLLDELPG